VTGEWRKLHNDELHIYSSPGIIRQIKSRRMRWAGNVARVRENCARSWWESPKERDHSEDQGVGGKMELEWILRRLAGTSVDWIRPDQDRDCWRAVVSAVKNHRFLAPRS
jgi:hypothetical protein